MPSAKNVAADYHRAGNLTNMACPSGTAAITNWLDALDRLTQRLDGLGTTVYSYAMLGNGRHTVTGRRPRASGSFGAANCARRYARARAAKPGSRPRRTAARDRSNSPTVTCPRGRDLSGSLAGAGGIGGLLARSRGYSGGNWSSHNYYHADGNGNVTALANGAGTLQASYKYDPYGRYLSGGGALASANVMRFSSKPWVAFAGSATSGLYYYGYRFYDPYLQRWVNRDPVTELGGALYVAQLGWVAQRDLHLYSAFGNSPAGRFDAFGLCDESDVTAIRRGFKSYKACRDWAALKLRYCLEDVETIAGFVDTATILVSTLGGAAGGVGLMPGKPGTGASIGAAGGAVAGEIGKTFICRKIVAPFANKCYDENRYDVSCCDKAFKSDEEKKAEQ